MFDEVDIIYPLNFTRQNAKAFRRLKCSGMSLIKGTNQNFRLCFADSSPEQLSVEIFDVFGSRVGSYIHASRPDSIYCKAWNINFGIKHICVANIIMLSDIDIIYKPNHIENVIKLMSKFDLLVSPVDFLEDENYSADYAECKSKKISRRIRFSGVFAVKKSVIYDLNGFDENYIGWGAEDNDFMTRCMAAGYKVSMGNVDLTVIHLPHDRNNKFYSAENKTKNRKRYLEKKKLYLEEGGDPRNVNTVDGWGTE